MSIDILYLDRDTDVDHLDRHTDGDRNIYLEKVKQDLFVCFFFDIMFTLVRMIKNFWIKPVIL